ncbi:MAG: hypothetical protein LBU51_06320, partial [Bacteroidales bacterium]|nr:hypothetical protein [Bacteroidales bacterium]
FDLTVFDEVDSLHDPVGPIKKAQELMAQAYDVEHSFSAYISKLNNIYRKHIIIKGEREYTKACKTSW